jgi:hypothetical protein
MENKLTIKLVEGKFLPSEARKVLFSLINSKINYHNLELFSAQERSDGNFEHSKLRIEYLKNASDKVTEFIKKATQNQYHLKIIGDIQIRMIKKDCSSKTNFEFTSGIVNEIEKHQNKKIKTVNLK